MRMFNKKRLYMSICFCILVITLLFLFQLDLFTVSRYETVIASSDQIRTAIFLLNDQYQTIPVKLPEVIPSNNQYTYSFSVSNYNGTSHCDTNLKYRIHIRTTTNMPIEYNLFKTLNIENAESYILSSDTSRDEDSTYFNNIYTDYNTFLYSEDNIDYYTILFTFPANEKEFYYSGFADYIEINVEASQILQNDT